MQLAGFHVILGSDTVKLGLYQIYLVIIAYITLIESNANHKVILVSILQFYGWVRIGRCTPLSPQTQTIHGQHNGQSSLKSLFHLCDV